MKEIIKDNLLKVLKKAIADCEEEIQLGGRIPCDLSSMKKAVEEAEIQPAPVQEPENHFKSACWLRTSFSIGRYLMSNAHGRWNGAEKALYHRELCKFYVAAVRGFDDEGLVDLCGEDFNAVHKSTQQLTDRMDEVIGFPLDSAPDYAKLEPLFFEHFHTLAMQALQVSQQPAPPAEVPLLTDEELREAFAQNLGGTYVCTRVWIAWSYGTMSEDDFYPASESDDLLDSLVQAVRQKAGMK